MSLKDLHTYGILNLRSQTLHLDAEPEDPDASVWPAITQGEHPTTGRPCFFLHPCETAAFLSSILLESRLREGIKQAKGEEEEATLRQYMETWMMLVSDAIQLRS